METLKAMETRQELKIQRALLTLGYWVITIENHVSFNNVTITAKRELPGDERVKELLSKCAELDL
jgi:hypothetical protein